MADFDWNWPKKIERDLIERALTLDFIREGRNLVLIGTNGLGKTMIAKNIAHQAVLAGFSVLFTTAAELIEDLRACVARDTFRRTPRPLRHARSCSSSTRSAISPTTPTPPTCSTRSSTAATRRNSIVLTTNLAFRDWNTVFPNATSIATLLDKLTHHADVTLIEGDSYRVHESQKEAAARRKKR